MGLQGGDGGSGSDFEVIKKGGGFPLGRYMCIIEAGDSLDLFGSVEMNTPKTMQKCRACGKKRSINSDTCPHCGDGTTAVEHIVFVVVVVAIVLGVMALLGG